MGNDQLGWYIYEAFAKKGVDVSHIIADKTLMTPQIFLAIHEPSGFERIFDYPENASDLALQEEDVDPEFIASSKALLVNGTHLSRPNLEAAIKKAIAAAKEAGTKVAFDVDFRPILWGLTDFADSANMFVADADTTKRLQAILPDCGLVIGTEEEIHILGGSEDTHEALRSIRNLTGAAIVLKRGAQGSVVFDADIPDDLDSGIKGPVFPVEVFNATGAGDGFMSGFLRGWIDEEPFEKCCEYANGCGAIVVSRHGCAPAVPSWEELQYFLSLKERPKKLWKHAWLNHMHWATATRTGDLPELTVLAFDHRLQFEEIAGGDEQKIVKAKELIAEAFKKIAAKTSTAGAIVDGQYGAKALEGLNGEGYWLSQAIEVSGRTPLEFVGGPNVGLTIQRWPQEQTIKCLIYYNLSQAELSKIQDERVIQLYKACRTLDRELLFEILPAQSMKNDNNFAAEVLHAL